MADLNEPLGRVYLTSTDKSNFRFTLHPEYKAHRKQPKPQHYDFLRQHLKETYLATEVFGQEADDQLAQDMNENNILVTIDKDLDQIEGEHYNFVKRVSYNVSKEGAHRSFYHQLLVGDSTDNIDGVPRVGKKTAERLLEGCQDEKEMFEIVVEEYRKAFEDVGDASSRMWLNANLLWIRRQPEQGFCLNGEVVSKGRLKRLFAQLAEDTSTKPQLSTTSSPSKSESTTPTGS
jgi:5'-3' exonuclease